MCYIDIMDCYLTIEKMKHCHLQQHEWTKRDYIQWSKLGKEDYKIEFVVTRRKRKGGLGKSDKSPQLYGERLN